MKEIVLDTETTGLLTTDGHRVVEIGCLELNDLIPTKKKFHCFLNPGRKVSEDAFKVHGYTDEFLSKQKKFSEIVEDFLNFINGKRLVIHNADFDITHLNNELNIVGKNPIKEEVVDTLQLARSKFPGSGTSLDALCKRYNIDNSRREKHNAVIDCELLSKVYINLLDQKEPKFELKIDKDFTDLSNINNSNNYSKKIVKPTENETLLHKEYLKKEIKKNFF